MSKVKIYVASSWRNHRYPDVIKALRDHVKPELDVYDFRNPGPEKYGFHWREIDPNWQQWTPAQFREKIHDPYCDIGFNTDMEALALSDLCLLVMPCGRSAHLEAGFAIGQGKSTAIYLSDGEPELMFRMADRLLITLDEVLDWVSDRAAVIRMNRAMDEFAGRLP